LDDEFLQYCELNKILDIENFAKSVFKRGFDIIKYGEVPMSNTNSKNNQEILKLKEENNKLVNELNGLRKKNIPTKQIKDNLYSE
jgi:hypothetical protein